MDFISGYLRVCCV